MEDNEVMVEETEIEEADLDAFDSAWEDDDVDTVEDDDIDEGSDADDGPNDSDEPDQQPEGQPDDADTGDEQSKEPAEETEEPGTEGEEGNQLFEITYLGNKEQLTLDQMKELAQKGRNYDHVIEERDKLKGESGRMKGFLQKLADKAGVSIDEQIDLTEAMWLMDDESAKGNTMTEAEALLRVQRAKNEAPEEEKAEDAETTNKMIDRFLAVYPDVQATEIPKEVWESAHQMGDLLTAYQTWKIKQLTAEAQEAKKAARNEQNTQRSTGPRKTSGASRKLDDFDAGWDSE